jgi:hypothetical protein
VSAEDKIRDSAGEYLDPGEEIVAAFVARPRGWTQSMAGSMHVGASQQRVSTATADKAGFALDSPMALAITDSRLLSLSMSGNTGAGTGGYVTGLVAAAPLDDVDKIKVKRLLVGKVVEVTVRGETFKLEVGAGANTKGVADAFDRLRA